MKQKLNLLIFVLGLTTLMPSLCRSAEVSDSVILKRIWDYRRNYTEDIKGVEQNVYIRSLFDVKRRNVLLFLVPSMYSIAKGQRQYLTESYGKFRFRDINDYDFYRQVVNSTIPHNRQAMAPISEFMMPNLYAVSLFPNHLLSPFHRANRRSYRYQVEPSDSTMVIVRFKPKLRNTQFVNGYAAVNAQTGRIKFVSLEGEYDMINFKVNFFMGQEDKGDLLPERCFANFAFNFMGNRIKAGYVTVFHCPTTLPDSIVDREDSLLMCQVRPIPLFQNEKDILLKYQQAEQAEENQSRNEKPSRGRKLIHTAWDIGDNLINSLNADRGRASINISPLLNPLYMSYSQSKGLSYKLDIGMRYAWNSHRYLTLDTRFGYSFKQRQLYYTLPLRMTYNPKRNGYAELMFANGNRTSNGALAESFKTIMRDTIGMPDFKDQYLQLVNNVMAFDWLEITAGVIYHRRKSTDPTLMEKARLPYQYKSFAPMLTLKFMPWRKGPKLTANYEHSISNVFGSNLNYERWEFDATHQYRLPRLRTISSRVGTGFYTHRSTEYFVDFTNFADNYLPTGWDDEWTGQFQVLDATWYNQSRYYVRGNVSYESPQLLLTRMPLVGRFIESERVYASILSIEHTRLYYELGYGFTNRYFSAGFFASFLGHRFDGFSSRFTIELFRRW